MNDVGHHVDLGLFPGDQLAVVPDILGWFDRHTYFLAFQNYTLPPQPLSLDLRVICDPFFASRPIA